MEEKTAEDRNEIEKIKMTLGAHLEELRSRILYSIIALVLLFIVCWFFKEQILEVAKRPHKIAMSKAGLPTELQVLSYQEGFYAYMKLCFITSILATYPFIVYQIWQFVSAGLYQKEKSYILRFLPVSYLAFVAGGFFGYFLLIPFGLQFLIGILGPGIQPIITMQQYISFVFMLTVALGLVFQLPLVMLLLSKIGFVSPDKFMTWRKYAILMIFIIAAIVTPPDPFTQTMTAGPMFILYELGILIARPTKKGFIFLGSVAGAGILVLAGVYFLMAYKEGEIVLLKHSGDVQYRYPGGEWEKVSGRMNFLNDVCLKTGGDGKAAVSIKKGVDVGLDVNTDMHVAGSRKILLRAGQIIVSSKVSNVILEIDTVNGQIRMKHGTVNIRATDYHTVVTAVKDDATLFIEYEEKKLLEGRQYKMSIGGELADIDTAINWSEGIIKREDLQK
ncbi:MAG: twin-arginine translocase subunit TatC [Candidatus Loosdrechtia sp.]|uniref:twin-arginine translocase subunit TatC n=1 Tax=Candidatus Loosdrechtia sp. TaxID=3101272 RepID=UPI003A66F5AD|nr:MAG: twin-arginine translocase subunit TatC [Candidatus Jettenia sp. AMX2]